MAAPASPIRLAATTRDPSDARPLEATLPASRRRIIRSRCYTVLGFEPFSQSPSQLVSHTSPAGSSQQPPRAKDIPTHHRAACGGATIHRRLVQLPNLAARQVKEPGLRDAETGKANIGNIRLIRETQRERNNRMEATSREGLLTETSKTPMRRAPF